MRSKFLIILSLFLAGSAWGFKARSEPVPMAPVGQAPSMQGWKNYSNPDFHLNFSYPSDWNLVASTAKSNFIILLLYQGPAKSAGQEDLRIDAYKDSKPEDENVDQDAGNIKYNAQLSLGTVNWKVFNEPLHPTAKTIPLYYLRKVQGSILYVVMAQNVTKLNPTQTQIVSSIKFE